MAPAPTSPPMSPKAAVATEETVKLQIQQFLDDWNYRMVHSSVAKTWDRKQVLEVALQVFELNGVSIAPGRKAQLFEVDEEVVIDQLVDNMSPEFTVGFEDLAMQLQMVVHHVSRVRRALEVDEEKTVTEVCEGDCGGHLGITQQILKHAVVHASKEVGKLRRCHAGWRKSTEDRIGRLMRSAEEAEQATAELVSVEAKLADFGTSEKEKAKKAMMSLLLGKAKGLLQSCVKGWSEAVVKQKLESSIRRKYEDELRETQLKFIAFKERSLKNVKGVFMRHSATDEEYVLRQAISMWKTAIDSMKLEGESLKSLQEVERRLSGLQASQAENAKKVMSRMSTGSEAGLKKLTIQSWTQYVEDSKKEKAAEREAEANEARVKAQLAKKMETRKGIFDRMMASSNSGLLTMAIHGWVTVFQEDKKARELEEALSKSNNTLKMMNQRQMDTAHRVQGRINEQMNLFLSQRCFSMWAMCIKSERIAKYFSTKMENKRRQLTGVQNLFKTFVVQLEQGLQVEDGDHSSRTTSGRESYARKPSTRKSKTTKGELYKPGMQKNEGSVSLPDIHQRPAYA